MNTSCCWDNFVNEIKSKIDNLLLYKEIVLIGIDGKSGAGKSTLGMELQKIYNSNIFRMDNFFLTPELRTEERSREIGGNVDYVRFKEEIMNNLLIGNSFSYRVFDCGPMMFTDKIEVEPKKVNIIEGCYSMHPTLANEYDLKIVLDIDEELQKERILKRNGPFMLTRFLKEWIPKENLYFEKMLITKKFDLYFYVSE